MEIFLGIMVDPMKNAMNPISNVITKLVEGGLSDKIKNNANNKRTISGWKIYFFKMTFLFKKDKKFSLGYNPLKKLLTQ